MVSKRITPDNITKLKKNEIFVYGSNKSNYHKLGGAKDAIDYFGAQMGVGGFCGQSYGIPTKDKIIKNRLSLDEINIYVQEFIEFVEKNSNLKFYVTEIGCGFSKYSPNEIAPLFKNVIPLEMFIYQ
jgi:hypothetical protein